MRVLRVVVAGVCGAGLTLGAVAPASGAFPTPAAGASSDAGLERTLGAVRDAGIPGVYSAVRDGARRWAGAAGVADVHTGRPVRPGMAHRVGSVTKTFTAVGVLQQVGLGRIGLDDPVADHLPGLLPADEGRAVTVRMLLNHTSGIGDYVPAAFPSLAGGPGEAAESLDEHRFRRIAPGELVRLGLDAPRTGAPGERFSYSNTNYVLAGLLLEEVTGMAAEDYLTERVIRPAGLRDTAFPRSPFLAGPHSRMYEARYGDIDPPRDYSVYDMSWAGVAGAAVSTMEDLNRFYAALFRGELLGPAELAELTRTVPADGGHRESYGLGVYPVELSCGRFWGHDGRVWGAVTFAFTSEDGERQAAVGLNLAGYQSLDEQGGLEPHPADEALIDHLELALCGPAGTPPAGARLGAVDRAP